MLDIDQIEAIIPHRDPFLLVDAVEDLSDDGPTVGYRSLSADEPFFAGHFPDYPVMPGVLIVEAMAQVGAVALLARPENRGKIAFFAGIDKVRFKREVKPGETLRMEVAITRSRGAIGFGEGKAFVGDELACSGELMFAIK
jgi:3-hydroxyacyl-[acyl-carrier-protein] dehydratase